MRITRHTLARIAVLLALPALAACDGSGVAGPPIGLAHSAATRSCGAADGPTVAIYLTGAEIESLRLSAPYLRVTVSTSIEHAAGRSWRLGDHHDNQAAFWTSGADYETADSGVVTISSQDPDSTVNGSLAITFPSGRRVIGGFRARWFPQTLRCG